MTKALLRDFGVRELGFNFRCKVVSVDSLAVNKNSTEWPATANRNFLPRGRAPLSRPEPQDITVGTKNLSVVDLAQPCGIFSYGIQHRLNVRR